MSAPHSDDEGSPEADGALPAWSETLARNLVRRAARKAPPGLTARLEEEWLADLAARHDAITRIRFGLGCCWATRVIARDFGVAAAATAGSASGQRLLVATAGHDFARLSRRTTALIAIVCLHAVIFYFYVNDFARSVPASQAGPFTTDFIKQPARQRLPTPIAPPRLAPTAIPEVPTPDIRLNLPVDPATITVAHSPEPGGVPVAAPKPADLVAGGPGAGFPNTGDFYPPAAIRLGESGTTSVRVCVDPLGRLTADPTVFQSSGTASIDQGALNLARAGSGHYRPTTANGQPVSACYAFRIRFQLDDQ
ncbi:MAG TPA: TonB family protein [Steroidobacteraceae bacterium]|nr:TonB family protein [Steroidobacteraceae bacterium]